MKLTKFFLTLTIGYAIMIFYLSSISDLRLPVPILHQLTNLMRMLYHSEYAFLLAPLYPLIKQTDKVLHILLYFGFGFLLYLSLRSFDKTIAKAIILAIFLGGLYGASDEFHQMFVAGRNASSMDLVADITGILLAQLFILVIYSFKVISSRFFRQATPP